MSTPNAKFAADRIALKLRKVNPEWCIPFDEIVQDAIDADNTRLTTALSTAEKERDAAKAWHREASKQVMALTAELEKQQQHHAEMMERACNTREERDRLTAEVAEFRKALIEERAMAIYNGMKGHDGWVPWVVGGNSIKQDDYRTIARAAMTKKGDQS